MEGFDLMARRMCTLSESPCYNCPLTDKCADKIKRSPVLSQVRDVMFGNVETDYQNCMIYISLTVTDIIDES